MKSCSILLLILCAVFVNIVEGSLLCKRSYTAYESDGNGNLYYLDRHNVTCGHGYSISSFNLERNIILKTYRYGATCCPINRSFSNLVLKSPFSIVINGIPFYLDRQIVSCNNNFISSFQLKRLNNDISYTYTCSNNMATKICYEDNTNYGDSGGNNGDVRYLERLKVACKTDYFLTKFQLVRKAFNLNQWRYVFNCCK